MNREEKADLLSELNELFNGAEVIVVSHYKGLTVKEVSELRNNVRKAGAGFRVTKNRITRLALKGTKFESLADLFKGPTAIAFANDPISACKACVEFAKTNENSFWSAVRWEPAFFLWMRLNVWQPFRLWTNCAPKLSACCRLLQLSWRELRRLTAKKKPHNFRFYAVLAGYFSLV